MLLRRARSVWWALLVGFVLFLPACGPKKVTGIEGCDEYLDIYKSCVKRVPPEQRKAFQENLDRTRAIWTAMAKDPSTRPGLPQSCDLARESAKLTMQSFHCDW